VQSGPEATSRDASPEQVPVAVGTTGKSEREAPMTIRHSKWLGGAPWRQRITLALGTVAAALALAACGSGGKY
jgi:hypothetical protein